MILTKLYKTIN